MHWHVWLLTALANPDLVRRQDEEQCDAADDCGCDDRARVPRVAKNRDQCLRLLLEEMSARRQAGDLQDTTPVETENEDDQTTSVQEHARPIEVK